MRDRPRPKNEVIVDRAMKKMLVIVAIISNATLLGLYLYLLRRTGDLELARTIIFVALGVSSVLVVYSVRSLRYMIWKINPFSNHYVTLSVLAAALMLVTSVYWTPLQALLRTVPLNLKHWLVILAFGLLNLMLIEMVKGVFLVRRKSAG